jgi:tRNA A37 threonylcarbamoyladenosine synthetase subunit TsaC/SUA5/YrdC
MSVPAPQPADLLEPVLSRVYEVLDQGGVALVPTSAGYGLVGVRAGAVERIYALKGRPAEKPCVVVVDWSIFDDIVEPPPPDVRAWMIGTVAWTPLAVVAPMASRSRLLAAAHPALLRQCSTGGTVAAYHNGGAVLSGLAARAFQQERLLVGSSANRSGTGNQYTLDEVPAEIRRAVDVIVDQGRIPTRTRQAATILELPSGRFLRIGIHGERIRSSWETLRAA